MDRGLVEHIAEPAMKRYLFFGVDRALSRLILRFRRSAIDLTHSERVSTSTSSFIAHRLAYSSQASMMILKFWCHENETGYLYFGLLHNISLNFSLRTILRSPVTIWPHGAYRNSDSQQEQGVGFLERPWKSICCRLATMYVVRIMKLQTFLFEFYKIREIFKKKNLVPYDTNDLHVRIGSRRSDNICVLSDGFE